MPTTNINLTIDKTTVGLSNVDNTSDANKPISTATQTALNLKVDKIAGKGLSTEDFTTAEKTLLGNQSGINTGDQDLSGLVVKANNLSDLTNAVDARTNLGAQAIMHIPDLGSFTPTSPSDGQTLYVGFLTTVAPNATSSTRQFKLPTGILRRADLHVDPTAILGSSEPVTVSLRNITDAVSSLIGTITYDSRGNASFISGLSIATDSTKLYALEYVYPTWATNPTNVTTTNHLIIYSE